MPTDSSQSSVKDPPKKLGFSKRWMVWWYSPALLFRQAFERMSNFFLKDVARAEGPEPREAGLHDYSGDSELWIDFVAETGDGWRSTFTVASLLARPRLTVGGTELKRGRLLIFGGDNVHPYASSENYKDRLVGPYRAALPWTEEGEAPDLFALPGSRDRTDGLAAFTDQFCDGGKIGGWQTRQTRSYFALQLPHRWWLWGVDVARSSMDPHQRDYFEEMAEHLKPGDRVILCSSEPSWLGSEASDRPFQSLDSFEQSIRKKGAIVALSLAGGRHHYVHYQAEDGEDPKILAGGGGTFVRETHSLAERIDVPVRHADGRRTKVKYSREATFPSADHSRRLSWLNLFFPLENLDLSLLLGVFYAVFGAIAGRDGGWLEPDKHLGLAFGNPWFYVTFVLVFLLSLAFVEPNPSHETGQQRRMRGILGLLHTSGHVFAALVVTKLAAAYNAWMDFELTDAQGRILLAGEGLLAGGFAAGLVVGVYLLASNRLAGCHQSSASAALRSPDYKGFLRLRLTADGLTVFPVGVEQVNRRWKKRTGGQRGDPWFFPRKVDLESLARLIEPAIEVRPPTRSQRTGDEDPARDWKIEEPPDDMVKALAAGECVLFNGSGLGAQAGLPTWTKLLAGLVEHASKEGQIDPENAEDLRQSLEAKRDEAVAGELLHLLPADLIDTYVDSRFSRQSLSAVHHLLADLPFAGAMTTSFDTLLEKAFRARKPKVLGIDDTSVLSAALRDKEFFLLALYGSANRPGKLFMEGQLRDAMARNRALAQSMQTIFQRYTLFFLGVSLGSIRRYVDTLRLAGGERPERPHFALVGEESELDPIEVKYLQREYGIRVLRYHPDDGDTEVNEFLKRLGEAGPSDTTAAAQERPVLERIRLTNIGPFTHLTVQLTPGWNVLLGDNGMGKTVILRAVAAALCGEAVDADAVKRLLKSDAGWGSIELEVGSRTYTVELQRDADGEVEIVSTSLSPLKLDNWLVLGFPALRSVTWDRPGGPGDSESSFPGPGDLLPILTGQPDERLNDLKQWLINIHYQASATGTAARRVATVRAKRLLARFFEVLNRLTPGLELRLHDIDRKTREIYLETDGRVVPLAAVSQGTASVIGWVGTLLQRMHEVNADQKDPEARGALVLVDEIDAHMHPGWQRLLTSRLQSAGDPERDEPKLFPTVQLIATTHSPLIVASLKQEEVQLVRRARLASRRDGVVRIRELDKKMLEVWVESGSESDSSPRYRLPRSIRMLVEDGETVDAGQELTEAEVDIVVEPLPFDIRGWRADQILTGPPFNLQSARDPAVEAALSRYTELAAKDDPDESDLAELADLARLIKVRLPTTAERQEAREAYAMIRESIAERTREMPVEKKRKMVDEIKVQLQESVTGSRRPQ